MCLLKCGNFSTRWFLVEGFLVRSTLEQKPMTEVRLEHYVGELVFGELIFLMGEIKELLHSD